MYVVSPKKRLKHPRAILAGKEWSIAVGVWDNVRSLLIRWNDDPDKRLGNPVSHGHATWFVLPKEFHEVALMHVRTARVSTEETARKWLNSEVEEYWPYDSDEFQNAE